MRSVIFGWITKEKFKEECKPSSQKKFVALVPTDNKKSKQFLFPYKRPRPNDWKLKKALILVNQKFAANFMNVVGIFKITDMARVFPPDEYLNYNYTQVEILQEYLSRPFLQRTLPNSILSRLSLTCSNLLLLYLIAFSPNLFLRFL